MQYVFLICSSAGGKKLCHEADIVTYQGRHCSGLIILYDV